MLLALQVVFEGLLCWQILVVWKSAGGDGKFVDGGDKRIVMVMMKGILWAVKE